MAKITEQEGIGVATSCAAGTLTSCCAAATSQVPVAMFTRINKRISAMKQGGPHEGTEV